MKALTLVYLLAAATAASTYGTVFASAAAAATNDVCSAGKLSNADVALVNGTNVANECALDGYSGFEFTFPTSTNVRSSFTFTGKADVYYGDIAITQYSSYPVDITIDKALLGSFSLSGSALAVGSAIKFTNCEFDGDFDIEIDAYTTTILLFNNSFYGSNVDVDFYDEDYWGDNVAVTVKNNNFYDGKINVDLDSRFVGSLTFQNNALHQAHFTHYTSRNDGTSLITGNSFERYSFTAYHQNATFQFSNNQLNTTNVALYVTSTVGVGRVEGNSMICTAIDETEWVIDLSKYADGSVTSFARNAFGQGCEVNNYVDVALPVEFPAGSAVNVDGNRFTIGTALVNHTFFEVGGSYFTAPYGRATLSLSANNFAFANGVKPADLQNSPLVFVNTDVSTAPVSRAMEEQGGGNNLNVKMSDNVVDGKVLSTPDQLGAYFGGFTDLYNNFEGTFSSTPSVYSAAPVTASIASAAAAMAACVVLMIIA